MTQPILEKSFYDNTLVDWLLALGIIVASVLIAKTVFWLMKNIVRKATEKTSYRFDSMLVDILEEPLVFSIILFGIWSGLKTLALPAIIVQYLDGAYHFAFIMAVAWFASRLVTNLIEFYLKPIVERTETTLDDQLLPILGRGVRITIWMLAILIGLDNAGYDVGALLAGLGLGGLAFAMAAKDTIANLFGSLTIFTDKPFTQGDIITVSGVTGTVQEVGIRSTRIKTFDNRIVTMANSAVANASIENITSEPSRKITMTLGLTYEMDHQKIAQAQEILRQIVDENDALEENAIISFNEFGDFSLNIFFVYYIKKDEKGSFDLFGTKNKVNTEILKRFNENGIDFAFPTQFIYTKSAD